MDERSPPTALPAEVSATTKRRSLWLVLGLSIVCFALINPTGEYLILDDWAFAKSLDYLHSEGRLVVLDWNAMTLTGHLVWGLFFTKVFGFSFFVTKIATFCAGILLVVSLMRFLQSHGARGDVSLLAALSLLLNPLFLAHAVMYMTDVTSLMWQWLSIGCVGAAWRRQGLPALRWALAGSALWGMAFLTRQHGVGIPIAIGAYLLLFDRQSLRRAGFLVALYFPGIVIAVVGTLWQRMTQSPTDAWRTMSHAVWSFLTHPPWLDLPFLFWSYAVYVGLFALPVCLALVGRTGIPIPGWKRAVLLVGMGIGLNLFHQFTLDGHYFPYIHNVITPWGMFRCNEFVVQEQTMPLWSLEWGIVVGLAGTLSALWLLATVLGALRSSPSASAKTVGRNVPTIRAQPLLLLVLCFQAAYVVATTPILFDRHLLLLAPTVIAIAALGVPKQAAPRRLMPILALAFYGTYGVVCTHDIHALSRAVWAAGDQLLQSGVDAAEIDAGYAFDGWHMYERSAVVQTPPLIQVTPWWPTSYPLPEVETRSAPWWISGLSTQVRPRFVVTSAARIPDVMYSGKYHYQLHSAEQSFRSYWPWSRPTVRVFRTIPIED